DEEPATFKVGDGNLLPGFEAALYGFKAGDKRSLQIEPENAFGQPNPQNVQVMPRGQFQDMELSEGLLIIFNDAANAELPGVVKAFDEQQVTIDFNHPLAGKTLSFDVEIIEVRPAWPACPRSGVGSAHRRHCAPGFPACTSTSPTPVASAPVSTAPSRSSIAPLKCLVRRSMCGMKWYTTSLW